MKRKGQPPRDLWVPLRQSYMPGHREPNDPFVAATMERYGVDRETAIKKLDDYEAASTYWINDLYQVERRALEGGLVHLNVRRRDGAIVRDWRHLQRIKNELLGAECEAIEIFPAESRLVDTSNKYHLWGLTDPTFRFQVGIDDDGKRDVIADEVVGPPGMRQRAIPGGDRACGQSATLHRDPSPGMTDAERMGVSDAQAGGKPR